MIKLKNLINEQNNKAPLKADNGQIIVGNNRYQLKADTVLPFVVKDIPISGLSRLENGNIELSYEGSEGLETAVIDNPNIISKLENDLSKGKSEIKIPNTILPPKLQKMVDFLLLSKV